VFRAARALVIHLIWRGYQRATDGGLRNKLAAHRAAIRDLSAPLPLAWTDEPGTVRAYLEQTLARGPASDLDVVAADLAEQKRQALLIGGPRVSMPLRRSAYTSGTSGGRPSLRNLPTGCSSSPWPNGRCCRPTRS